MPAIVKSPHCPKLSGDFGPDRVIVECAYRRGLRDEYFESKVLDEWFAKYKDQWPFHESLRWDSKQLPPLACGCSSALYVATKYLDARYQAHLRYRYPNEIGGGDGASYEHAKTLLGEAAESILGVGKGGEPPELLVFKPGSDSFRFVEMKRALPGKPSGCAKSKDDRATKNQRARFDEIEDSLKNDSPKCEKPLHDPSRLDLFPELPPGHWIHIVCLVEEGS